MSNTELSEFLAPHQAPGQNSVSSSQPIVRVPKRLTEFSAELTEFAPKLSEAQCVLFSETVLLEQYSARFLINHAGELSKRRKGTRYSSETPLETKIL